MSLYERWVLPRLVDAACSRRPAMRQRQEIVRAAHGTVLEVGFGTGLNLGFYSAYRIDRIWALEPSLEMWNLARERVLASGLPVRRLDAAADHVPLDDGSVDTVLSTYCFCTLPDPQAALAEIGRVLRPGGRLLFCEHGAAPEPGVRRWQRRLDPVWSRLAGGCHLDREIPKLLERGGFEIHALTRRYIPGWRPASFNYWGSATLH